MATWIELRCENRDNPSANTLRGQHSQGRCHSNDNSGPMELANDTRKDILETLRIVETQAREDGWTKTRYGWVCPFCSKQPNHRQELAAEYASFAAPDN